MSKPVTVLLVLLALASVFGAGRMHTGLLEARRAYRLNQGEPLENAPPIVAFTTVALGGFRGLLADILWIRASTLQDQGRYFELVQIASWITTLEPRFTPVWAFQAWNMAYNISVLFRDPRDRWRWVEHGVNLLRDEGLLYNPGSAGLYRELGWLFQHKIGGAYDTAHRFYKEAWAREMQAVLDGPFPDFDALPRVSLDRLERRYKLRPDLMQSVQDRFGPLDWRLAQTHALYWAAQGLEYASPLERIALDRMIFQALAESLREGRLLFPPSEGPFLTAPNPDLLPAVLDSASRIVREHPDIPTFAAAYDNLLSDAILVFYTLDDAATAYRLFDALAERNPLAVEGKTLDDIVYTSFAARAGKVLVEEAPLLVEEAAYRAYFWAGIGEERLTLGYDRLARLCWQRVLSTPAGPLIDPRDAAPALEALTAAAQQRAADALRALETPPTASPPPSAPDSAGSHP